MFGKLDCIYPTPNQFQPRCWRLEGRNKTRYVLRFGLDSMQATEKEKRDITSQQYGHPPGWRANKCQT